MPLCGRSAILSYSGKKDVEHRRRETQDSTGVRRDKSRLPVMGKGERLSLPPVHHFD